MTVATQHTVPMNIATVTGQMIKYSKRRKLSIEHISICDRNELVMMERAHLSERTEIIEGDRSQYDGHNEVHHDNIPDCVRYRMR